MPLGMLLDPAPGAPLLMPVVPGIPFAAGAPFAVGPATGASPGIR
jgi:hypothetical protein